MKKIMEQTRSVMASVHRFHIRYRWAFLLMVVAISAAFVWGSSELFKALWGLGLEQVLLRAGQFAKSAEEA